MVAMSWPSESVVHKMMMRHAVWCRLPAVIWHHLCEAYEASRQVATVLSPRSVLSQ